MKLKPGLVYSCITASAVVLSACGNTTVAQAPASAAPSVAAVAASSPSAPVSNVALPAKPKSSGAAREAYQVNSLKALVDKSDLVIVGRATDVKPGRNAGTEIGGKLGFRDVTVEVQQVLHGKFGKPSLVLEELGWKDGEPFTINQAAWASKGDTMLMGLRLMNNAEEGAEPHYILTGTPARFFLKPDGQVDDNYLDEHEADEAGPFVKEAKKLDAEKLIQKVEAVE